MSRTKHFSTKFKLSILHNHAHIFSKHCMLNEHRRETSVKNLWSGELNSQTVCLGGKVPRDTTLKIEQEMTIPTAMYSSLCICSGLGVLLAVFFFIFNLAFRSNRYVLLKTFLCYARVCILIFSSFLPIVYSIVVSIFFNRLFLLTKTHFYIMRLLYMYVTERSLNYGGLYVCKQNACSAPFKFETRFLQQKNGRNLVKKHL